MAVRFDGRVAVVTGAGGGLGRSHAMMLASRGCKVVVNDRGGSTDGTGAGTSMADKVVEEIRAAGGEAVANYDSVDSWAGGEAIIKTALDAFGKIDIVINNAGILRDRTLAKMTDEEYRRVIDVHLNGAFYVTRAAFDHLRKNNYGRILFTTSAAGLWGNFGQTNYSAAKMGLVGMMHTVKLEGAKFNINANTIAPIAASRLMGTVMSKEAMENLIPRYVSAIACFLVSENCRFSGGIFNAGGGHYSRAAMMEGPGIHVASMDEATCETVEEKFSDICDLTGAQEFRDAMHNMQVTLAGKRLREGSKSWG